MKTNAKGAIAGSALLSLLLVGCSGAEVDGATNDASQTDDSGSTATAGLDCSIVKGDVIWWTESESDEAIAAQEEIFVGSLKESSPGISLTFERYGEGIEDVVRAAVQGGGGPDIIQMRGPSSVKVFADAGLVVPLEGFAQELSWEQKLAPWALSIGETTAGLTSVPLTYESGGMLFYNPKIFAELGLEPPTDLATMTDVAEALKAAGIAPFANGGQTSTHVWPVFLNSLAGPETVYSALTGETQWTDPRILGAMSQYEEWLNEGWFSGSIDKYMATDWNQQAADFAAGDAGMLVQGTWMISILPSYTEDSEAWDFVPFPSLADGIEPGQTLSVGSTLSINSNSSSQEAAACVLDHLYNDVDRAAAMVSALQGEWNVPIDLSAAEWPSDVDPKLKAHLEAVAQAASSNNYGYAEWTFYPAKTYELWSVDINRVFTGEESAPAFLTRVQNQFEEEAAAGDIPPIPQR